MDQLEIYQTLLSKILSQYAKLSQNNTQLKSQVIISEDRQHFLLINEGWEGKKHIHACLFHAEIRENKIWIYFDGFEESVTEQLMLKGISQEQMVLAFHPPYIRKQIEMALS
ncbi:MAG: XisI protein [Microcystaceae cyanobacterium]